MSGEFLAGPVAQAIGWSLLHLVWEAALVAGILAAVLALMTRRSANARYIVSCAALALLPLLAAVTAYRAYEAPLSAASAPSSDRTVAPDAPVSASATLTSFLVPADDSTTLRALAESARDWLPQIVLLWLVGVTFFSIRLVVSWTRVQRLAKSGVPDATSNWQRVASRLAESLRLRRAIQLLESAAVEVPTVIGWLRPVILLPASTLSGLTAEQIEMVLAHELAHIRRHDFFVNMMQTVVETLMFYHPAVWWVSNRIRNEREHCCDDLAIAVCGNPLQYARALTRLEELRAAQTELAVAANGGSLLMRIRRLVVSQKESTGGAARWAAGAAVLAVLILLVTLPTLPALANHEKSDKTKDSKSETGKTAKSQIDVNATKHDSHEDETTVDAGNDSDHDSGDDAEVNIDTGNDDDVETPETPEVPGVAVPAPAPAASPAPAAAAAPAPAAPRVFYAQPAIAIAPSLTPAAINEAVAIALAENDAPRVRVRLRGREFGANGKLTVDELIALRNSGVTPDYINDMRANSGFADLTLGELLEMRTQGITPRYLKEMRDAGIPLHNAREAVELKVQGVNGAYVAAMAAAGFKNLSAHDLVSLRVQGVTSDYISQLSAAGYKNLSVRDVVKLRAMGVTTAFIKTLADAGYNNLSADDLARLAASGVNADFIREMQQYRKK